MKSKRDSAGRELGFSLVELMVVISIIGLLSAIVSVSVLKAGDKAKQKKVVADVKGFDDAIVMYRNDTSQWPQSLQDLIQGTADGWDGPYVKNGGKALMDPWNRPYVYQFTGSGDPPYQIGSYGADGSPSGSGENTDIFPHAQ